MLTAPQPATGLAVHAVDTVLTADTVLAPLDLLAFYTEHRKRRRSAPLARHATDICGVLGARGQQLAIGRLERSAIHLTI